MSVVLTTDKAEDEASNTNMHIIFGDKHDESRTSDNHYKSDDSDSWNKTFYDVLVTCEKES